MKRYSISLIFVILLFVLLSYFAVARTRAQGSAWRIASVVTSPLSYLGQKASNMLSAFGSIGSLRQSNLELTKKIAQLEVDRSQIAELEHENEVLKKELGFAESNTNEELIPSRIIGREPTAYLDYIIINKGSDDGVAASAAVVSENILIGRVSEVYSHQAKIVLVTSKDSIVQAMLQNSRSKGLLRGGVAGLVLENIPQDAEFVAGENIVTSGLGGDLPEGILIGKARSLQYPVSGIFKSVSVESITDLAKLEIVFVKKK